MCTHKTHVYKCTATLVLWHQLVLIKEKCVARMYLTYFRPGIHTFPEQCFLLHVKLWGLYVIKELDNGTEPKKDFPKFTIVLCICKCHSMVTFTKGILKSLGAIQLFIYIWAIISRNVPSLNHAVSSTKGDNFNKNKKRHLFIHGFGIFKQPEPIENHSITDYGIDDIVIARSLNFSYIPKCCQPLYWGLRPCSLLGSGYFVLYLEKIHRFVTYWPS